MSEPLADTLVWIREPAGPAAPAPVGPVRERLGIASGDVYREWPHGFGARLTAAQTAALRDQPEVLDVRADEPGRPAPYRRTSSPSRAPGSYFVMMRAGSDPAETARAAGVRPRGLYRISFTGFGATMTDQQLAAVRRSPDVTWILDDLVAGP